MNTIYIYFLLAILTIFPVEALQSQTRPLPLAVTCRKSLLEGSYVLQIQNSSKEDLDLWLQAKGKVTPFVLPAGKMKEFGWAQGYRFDANNLFLIGGNGYDTLRQVMPNVELSPWRIGFSTEGGLALSFSQAFLQARLPKYLELPVKQKASNVLEISLNQVPQIILKEGSDRIYSDAVLEASFFSGKVRLPIVAGVSFVPSYNAGTGELTASQIKIENIALKFPHSDLDIIPKDWTEQATQVVNKMLPVVFAKYVLYKLEKNWILKIAKAVNLRTKVLDGRLELVIL